jgi:hypothetical protein
MPKSWSVGSTCYWSGDLRLERAEFVLRETFAVLQRPELATSDG